MKTKADELRERSEETAAYIETLERQVDALKRENAALHDKLDEQLDTIWDLEHGRAV